MYINKYQKLTVRELRKILFDIEDQDAEIISIDFYDKDCQEIEGEMVMNRITLQNSEIGNLEWIDIIQTEIES